MSVQHVMEKHPTFVDIFQIGPKWWADQQIDTASPKAMLPAWLKKGKAERRKRKKNLQTNKTLADKLPVSYYPPDDLKGRRTVSIRQVQADTAVHKAVRSNIQ